MASPVRRRHEFIVLMAKRGDQSSGDLIPRMEILWNLVGTTTQRVGKRFCGYPHRFRRESWSNSGPYLRAVDAIQIYERNYGPLAKMQPSGEVRLYLGSFHVIVSADSHRSVASCDVRVGYRTLLKSSKAKYSRRKEWMCCWRLSTCICPLRLQCPCNTTYIRVPFVFERERDKGRSAAPVPQLAGGTRDRGTWPNQPVSGDHRSRIPSPLAAFTHNNPVLIT
jgi:hypothetical protein